jgi:hypothetical protein
LNGKVFLWDVPEKLWEGWTKDHFEIFEAVVPKPGKYILRADAFQISNVFLLRNIAYGDWPDNVITTTFSAFIYERDWNSNGFHGHGVSRLISNSSTLT